MTICGGGYCYKNGVNQSASEGNVDELQFVPKTPPSPKFRWSNLIAYKENCNIK